MKRRSWQLPGPFDLGMTLRFVLPGPGAESLAARSGNRYMYAVATGEGDASVILTVEGERLHATAIGPGAEPALADVERLVGFDDDFVEFSAAGGLLRDLDRRYRGLRLGSTGRVFESLLPIVLGQRVTTDEAAGSYRRLVRAYGRSAPGGHGLTVPPAAEVIANLQYEDLHRFGVERTRAQILIEAARRASRLEEISAMSRSDARQRLGAVRGVGPWTVALVMGVAWGDRDAVPRGDFHIPHMVSWLLAGEPRGTDDRMEELLEPFRPHRRRAVILLKLSGRHAPRYGPRSPKGTIGTASDH